jgi:serine/threonine protein kinase
MGFVMVTFREQLLTVTKNIKSDNILVDPSGTIKISYFDTSKRAIITNEGAAFTAMQGTIFWMAPEAVKVGLQGCTSKIDIWSLGCVVLEMWSGQHPWHDQEIFAVMFKVRYYSPRLDTSFSRL